MNKAEIEKNKTALGRNRGYRNDIDKLLVAIDLAFYWRNGIKCNLSKTERICFEKERNEMEYYTSYHSRYAVYFVEYI